MSWEGEKKKKKKKKNGSEGQGLGDADSVIKPPVFYPILLQLLLGLAKPL